MDYKINIVSSATGTVYATIHRVKDGNITNRAMYRHFDGLFSSLETNFKSANKWAKKTIAVLEKYEVHND